MIQESFHYAHETPSHPTPLLRNLLSLVGSFSSSAVNTIGIFFALVNITFSISLIILYEKDMKKNKKVQPVQRNQENIPEGQQVQRARTKSARESMGKSVANAEKGESTKNATQAEECSG